MGWRSTTLTPETATFTFTGPGTRTTSGNRPATGVSECGMSISSIFSKECLSARRFLSKPKKTTYKKSPRNSLRRVASPPKQSAATCNGRRRVKSEICQIDHDHCRGRRRPQFGRLRAEKGNDGDAVDCDHRILEISQPPAVRLRPETLTQEARPLTRLGLFLSQRPGPDRGDREVEFSNCFRSVRSHVSIRRTSLVTGANLLGGS